MRYTFQLYCQDVTIINCVLTCLKCIQRVFRIKEECFPPTTKDVYASVTNHSKNSVEIQMDSEFIADPAPMPITMHFQDSTLFWPFFFFLFCLLMIGLYNLVRELNEVVFQGHKILAFPEVIWATIAQRKKGFNPFFPEVKHINMDFKHCHCPIKWNQSNGLYFTNLTNWVFFYWQGKKYLIPILDPLRCMWRVGKLLQKSIMLKFLLSKQ